MITDDQTNFLYLSDKLPLKQSFYLKLTSLLKEEGINFELLPNTKDIWAVDYMPIQVDSEKFIQFIFEPSYLQSKTWIQTQTNPKVVCKAILIRPQQSHIKLDGGNLIKGKNWVILTDKIFSENKNLDKKTIIDELEFQFQSKVIIIPREPGEITGHADGILKYYEDETVLVNSYKSEYLKSFEKKLKRSLNEQGLKAIEIPFVNFNDSKISATGLYINFLQMKNFILMPTFGIPEDDLSLKLFEQLYKGQSIKTIDSRDISVEGGVLNCITWNIHIQ